MHFHVVAVFAVFVIDNMLLKQILGFMLGFIGFGGTEFFRRELTRMMEMMPGGSSNQVREQAESVNNAPTRFIARAMRGTWSFFCNFVFQRQSQQHHFLHVFFSFFL